MNTGGARLSRNTFANKRVKEKIIRFVVSQFAKQLLLKDTYANTDDAETIEKFKVALKELSQVVKKSLSDGVIKSCYDTMEFY